MNNISMRKDNLQLIHLVMPIVVVSILLILVYLFLCCYTDVVTLERYLAILFLFIFSSLFLSLILFLTLIRLLPTIKMAVKTVILVLLITSSILSDSSLESVRLSVMLEQFFPEEVVADMIALYQRLSSGKKSKLLFHLIPSIWALYVQIKIENLHLPSKPHNAGE
jgi:hypothetical protein